ncbi:MAG: hypothetical protein R3E48_20505 [Burkholderiaceae bacterium]
MSAGRDDRNDSASVRAVDAFVEGNGALARLLREQPEWPMPADISARFASALARAEAEPMPVDNANARWRARSARRAASNRPLRWRPRRWLPPRGSMRRKRP